MQEIKWKKVLDENSLKSLSYCFLGKKSLEYEKYEEEEGENEILRVIISNIHLLAYVAMFLRCVFYVARIFQ